jgi:hypothetical protein
LPTYANADGKVVVFFQDAGKFNYRYSTLGFQDAPNLDDGDMWPVSYALKKWSPAVERKVVNPADHSLWVGTGEANTSSDSYAGTGVLISTDGGAHFSRVGGDELQNTLVRRIVFGPAHVYVATSKGLFRRSLSAALTDPWTRVLYPATCPQAGARRRTPGISVTLSSSREPAASG